MPMLSSIAYWSFLLLVATAILSFSVQKKKLTPAAAIAATGIGILIFTASGIKGILMLLSFFGIGVWATAHKKQIKNKHQSAAGESTGRNVGQVFANGGVAALTGLLMLVNPAHHDLYLLMMAASLASALADTLSSELGMVYGRSYVNVLTFKKETNGLDGVISLEGTIIGAFGALIIGILHGGPIISVLIITIAGILGNFCDSILGATLERKHWIGNNMVNFLNTLIAALLGGLFYLYFIQ